MNDKKNAPRGFAAMDPAVVADIARKGGKAAHAAGTAHEFTSDEARRAGSLGGKASHANRKNGGNAKPAAEPSHHAKTAAASKDDPIVHSVCAAPSEGGACGAGDVPLSKAGPEYSPIPATKSPKKGAKGHTHTEMAMCNAGPGGSCAGEMEVPDDDNSEKAPEEMSDKDPAAGSCGGGGSCGSGA